MLQKPKANNSPELTNYQAKSNAKTSGKKAPQAHTAIWVPKQLAKAQAGTTQMWVPKQALPKGFTCAAIPTNRQRACHFKEAQYKGFKAIAQKERSRQQVRLPKEQQGSQYRWKPKRNPTDYNSETNSGNNKAAINHKHNCKTDKPTTLKWVRKSVLQAQGFFEGQTQLWLPKSHLTQAEVKDTTKGAAIANGKQAAIAPLKETKVWVPTRVGASIPEPTIKPRLTKAQKEKWVPKQTKEYSSSCSLSKPMEAASTSKTTITIVERAIQLQIQLFGMVSLKKHSTLVKALLAQHQAAYPAKLPC